MNLPAAIVIGGILPAICWGVTGIFQKLSAQHGTPPGPYLLIFGLVIALSGVIGSLAHKGAAWPAAGIGYAVLAGITFSAGTGFISYALWRYGVPISKLAPILGTNVVVTVVIGLFVLGEMQDVRVGHLLAGMAAILIGATLVTNA